ncbi:MAG: PocR ligand-binding domain-containing protein [Victivallaceae bacterium]|nr:PocR ligand-binding domain-containing protein [Victivallaceae bacterium]
MLHYTIRTDEMNTIMELLFRVLDIRITFFDLGESELDVFHIKEMSEFCREHRMDGKFRAACTACDRENLEAAKALRDVHIYHCHAGLLEGIVPLYARKGQYLGAIVYGQVRDVKRAEPATVVRALSAEKMRDIGRLLKYLGEYICSNELVKQCAKPWGMLVSEYLEAHLSERVTLDKLASVTGKSVSFLSHNIPQELGCSLKQYMQQRRITEAEALLAKGKLVRECADLLGYYDAFHFSKEFKRLRGRPPKSCKQ